MRLFLPAACAAVFVSSIASAETPLSSSWPLYGGNPQHTAIFEGRSQNLSNIHWQASLDDDRAYYGSEVLIHYASAMITPSNTVVHGYRFTTTVNGSPNYDNWQVIGRSARTGQELWSFNTDYNAPEVWPSDWTSVFPMAMVNYHTYVTLPWFPYFPIPITTTAVAAAASGGTILVKPEADSAGSQPTRIPFYTTLKDYNANASKYAPLEINTPVTSDAAGNLYFGYLVNGTLPTNLASELGTGGIAKVNPSTGATKYISVSSLNINSGLAQVAMNSAPAVSNDGNYLYVALCPSGGGTGFLAKLKTSNLAPVASVEMFDPSVPGGPAQLINESSASPMVGPDGHVFMGVFGYYYRESHGWMLQFDENLNQNDPNGVQYPIGAFGWDDTASVVPANIVPSYKGKASYLILSKYNNYAMGGDPGANGNNHVAVLDPSSNSISTDRQSGLPVMNEILLVLSPTANPNLGGFDEWCINSAVVDVAKKSAIINCEDGHCYRWDLTTNTLSQAINLQPATGEAYTSTIIGPDGTIYAINNSILFAIGN